MARVIISLIILIQSLLTLRFVVRLWRTRNVERIEKSSGVPPSGQISVLIPVLDEVDRLAPCIDSLADQQDGVSEILVIDGGSRDGTQELVLRFAESDPRIRLICTGPIPDCWNGKAYGLQTGIEVSSPDSDWLVTIDSDVRVANGGVSRAVRFAESRSIPVLSVATNQVANTHGLSLVHPSLLSTLVYRFGRPGNIAGALEEVQANGQFGVYHRASLVRAGGLRVARDSICEDITLARHLYLSGNDVGFFEGDDIAETEMYPDAVTCLKNWPRSLSLKDRFLPEAGVNGLLNIAFLQVIPLVAHIWMPTAFREDRTFRLLNQILMGIRIGILAGTRRAYRKSSPVYWLSPLVDPITLVFYAANLVRRTHTWRGRQLISRET
jgi:dolichol-phosphate mannosyltransferase